MRPELFSLQRNWNKHYAEVNSGDNDHILHLAEAIAKNEALVGVLFWTRHVKGCVHNQHAILGWKLKEHQSLEEVAIVRSVSEIFERAQNTKTGEAHQ
jgi:hypothetical protein